MDEEQQQEALDEDDMEVCVCVLVCAWVGERPCVRVLYVVVWGFMSVWVKVLKFR